MDCLLSLLNQVHSADVECCAIIQEFASLANIRTFQKLRFFLSLIMHEKSNAYYNFYRKYSGHGACKLFTSSGSAAEGGMMARCFGLKDNRIEMEVDCMIHIGTISNVQLIPCTRLGFYKLDGFIDIRTVIPDTYHRLDGVEEYMSAFLTKYCNCNGYISATSIKSVIDRNTKTFYNATKYFEKLCGIHSSQNGEFPLSPVEHGPAIMWTFVPNNVDFIIKSIYVDGVISLGVSEWPDLAVAWIFRERIWPTVEVIEKIINDGCCLVAKNPDWNHSEEGECDAATDAHWRLSFSLAEKHLAKARSETQKCCYFAFKSIFYFKFSDNLRMKQISSYLAKTVFLWTCEGLTFDAMEQKEIIVELFVALGKYLRNNHLPNYFIPDINLLQNLSDNDRCAIIDIVTVTIYELRNSDRKLISDLRRIGLGLLNNMKLVTTLTRRLAWNNFCDISIGQTTFLSHLPREERQAALSSDPRVIGFCVLLTYCASKDRLNRPKTL